MELMHNFCIGLLAATWSGKEVQWLFVEGGGWVEWLGGHEVKTGFA
jgi:hypothetical protein